MIPRLGILALLFLSSVASTNFTVQTPDKSCRQHPQLIGACFNVHGRLSVYNGAPALRIWKAGTKRILGVSEQRFTVAGYRNIPDEVKTQVNQDVDVWGDFLVCPFTKAKAGEMQMVCVEAGRNVKIKQRNP